MTEYIFNQWLLKLDKKMVNEKRTIALVVDNCTAHNSPPKLDNVEVYFFPPNCTSVLQPLDMGIIRCFKSYYRKRLVERILLNIENKFPKPFDINVKQACDDIAGSWREVQARTVKNCWKKAGFSSANIGVPGDEIAEDNPDSEETEVLQGLLSCFQRYEESSGEKIQIPADEYIRVDDGIHLFPETTDEDILQGVKQNCEAGEEEEEEEEEEGQEIERPASEKKVSNPEEAVQTVEALQNYLSTLPNVPDVHFTSLDAVRSMCVSLSMKKMKKQTKISDFF